MERVVLLQLLLLPEEEEEACELPILCLELLAVFPSTEGTLLHRPAL
jgi:hypothetical protein